MAHSFTNLLYHLVFATEGRDPILDPSWRRDLFAYIGGVIRAEEGIALRVNGMADHIHILLKFRPSKSVSDLLADIKGRSSGWVRRTRPGMENFAWQTGYGAFPVSQSQVERVRLYVENQEQHHLDITFPDELKRLLAAHGCEIDEEMLWG
jgi:REP element-mobilizing transposase RayT